MKIYTSDLINIQNGPIQIQNILDLENHELMEFRNNIFSGEYLINNILVVSNEKVE